MLMYVLVSIFYHAYWKRGFKSTPVPYHAGGNDDKVVFILKLWKCVVMETQEK